MSTADTTERRIADRYVLHESLGKGGMGVVWRAHDSLLNRTVAIKEIETPRQLNEPEAQAIQARAMREARSAARLTHPAVVTIYDVVQEESQSYIVMEFVDAPTLEHIVKQNGTLSPDEAARVGLDLLDALQMAHANGIVHRDVKPSNVMITANGRAKLADFGIASVKDDPKITSTGMILGSPQFMAPEQAQGSGSGPPADLWALGATLYFAVEGRYPFDRGEAIPTLAAVVHDDFAPLTRAGWFTPVITALLNKRPERRPTDAQLRRMLEPNVADGETALPPAAPPTPRVSREQPAVRKAPRRKVTRWLALVLLGLLLIAGVGAILWVQGDDATPPQAESGEQRRGGSRAQNNSESPEANAPETTTEDPEGTDTEPEVVSDPEVEVPSDWARYRDPAVGWRLRYPAEWEQIQNRENSIDFRDPNTGTYLRVEWTTSPGPSPEGAWETLAASFSASHSGYEEIGITPTTYKGHDAAVWEFQYTEGGARLHAADLGFVIGDEYGFALYFQTREENWASSQQLFEQLKSAFKPPSV
jgi:eukaryotic-like serine/threonine-protein kinase